MLDMTKPNPDWTPDQLHVYLERLAIQGENKAGNTHGECVIAYRQAEEWQETKQEKATE